MKKEVLMVAEGSDIWCHYHLVGDKGGINFSFIIQQDFADIGNSLRPSVLRSMDVGVHHKTHVEGWTHIPAVTCACTGHDECWYEGSGLLAEKWLKVLKSDGSDAIWKLMEDYYKYNFK